MRKALLDTSALVALLDADEQAHEKCASFFSDFNGEFVSCEAVLTEATHLLSNSIRAQKLCVEFFATGGAHIIPQSVESLSRISVLMEKYADIPMDFADASLVSIAEETGISEVFTLDRRGFAVYRIKGRKTFSILP